MRLRDRLFNRNASEEAHAEARLENAERDLRDLKARAHSAITTLDARNSRNHWRESIEQMIQGAPRP